jgi:hypothetical protein
MLYTLSNVELKTDGPYGPTLSCSAAGVDNSVIPKATIYKKQKDGTDFPNFDTLREGTKVECNPWTNPKGYVSLFPPKPETASVVRRSPAAITKAMETKAANIEKAQDNKQEGIKISSTMRDAVAIVVSMNNHEIQMNAGEIKEAISTWRKWLWYEWDKTEQYPPFMS